MAFFFYSVPFDKTYCINKNKMPCLEICPYQINIRFGRDCFFCTKIGYCFDKGKHSF